MDPIGKHSSRRAIILSFCSRVPATTDIIIFQGHSSGMCSIIRVIMRPRILDIRRWPLSDNRASAAIPTPATIIDAIELIRTINTHGGNSQPGTPSTTHVARPFLASLASPILCRDRSHRENGIMPVGTVYRAQRRFFREPGSQEDEYEAD